MFAFFHALRLNLAQPALTADSYFSWPNLLQAPGQLVRYTSFVEVMAPLFDRDTLRDCLSSFSESRSGWGLDWVWGHLCQQSGKTMAIIDATPVKHTRPVASGGDLYKNNPELDPKLDRERLVAKYGLAATVELGAASGGTPLAKSAPIVAWAASVVTAITGLGGSCPPLTDPSCTKVNGT